MIKIMFVCHGNICRSPMAEFVLKDLVKKEGLEDEFIISSSATSTEEIWNGVGNTVYPPAFDELKKHGIDAGGKRAVQLKAQDLNKYDYFICMDERNYKNMLYIFGEDKENKCYKLLNFTDKKGDVADPYWTGDFNATLFDVELGLNGLYEFLEKE